MYQFLNKYGQTAAFGLGVLVILIFLGSVFGGLEDFNSLGEDNQGQTSIFDFGLKATMALTVICFVLLVGFGLFQIVTDLKGSMKGLISFGLVAVIFLIAWKTSDATITPAIANAAKEFNVTGGQVQFISGSLKTGLFMSVAALALLFLAEIRNFFK